MKGTMTLGAQPHDLQGLGIVRMVSFDPAPIPALRASLRFGDQSTVDGGPESRMSNELSLVPSRIAAVFCAHFIGIISTVVAMPVALLLYLCCGSGLSPLPNICVKFVAVPFLPAAYTLGRFISVVERIASDSANNASAILLVIALVASLFVGLMFVGHGVKLYHVGALERSSY
jgi:hypothetical protein